MAIAILDNLRGFATSRPPLVIFMICLASFAVVLITFAYIVKINDLPRSDISENWNTFLDSFSKIDFCVVSNSSETVIEPATIQRSTKELLTQAVTTPTQHSDALVNVSVTMIVVLTPTVEYFNIPRNITHISTTVTGEQLGLEGIATDQTLNMTFMLPNQWNTSHCNRRGQCRPLKVTSCVSFQAPLSVFPRTRMPATCQAVNDSGSEYHLKMIGTTDPDYVWCQNKPALHVEHYEDPDLEIMLSFHDKSVINLHLLHTSYFLFMMVITLFCYAIVKGRPAKSKLVQYIPAEKTQMTA